MKSILKTTLFGITAVAVAQVAGAGTKAPASQRNFVACPIVIDTLDIPCWVAEYEGERYFLTVQTGRSYGVVFAPQLKHKVLVEGTVTDAPRQCGGIVLKDVKLSVMEEVDLSCDTILPGDGYQTKGPRPIGPDGDPPGGKTTAVRMPPDPVRGPAARKARLEEAAKKREQQEFVVEYFFDSNYIPFPAEQAMIDQAADYAAAIKASRVEVVGYRGSVVLSDGNRMTEKEGLAQLRAKKVASILRDFGVADSLLHVSWKDAPEDAGGVRDYEKRRVTINVIP